MSRNLLVLVLPFLFAPMTVSADDGTVLRTQTQALLDAVAPGEKAVWAQYLHADFVMLDENGRTHDRTTLLEMLSPLPAGLEGRMEIDTFEAAIHGDMAITVYEIQEYLDYHGQPLRSRFRSMDTWLKNRDGWRLVSAHVAAVLKDPPRITLPEKELCEYAGRYELTNEIMTTIRCADDKLISERPGRPAAHYLAEFPDIFFVPGQPRTRRIFLRDTEDRVTGFVDRREGEDIHWVRSED